MIHLKRAYEPVGPDDGQRILVERLWPRGLRKEQAHLDEWLKDLAPSDSLRRWFHTDPSRWPEFEKRYRRELTADAARAMIGVLRRRARVETLTLIYAAHDEEHNSAVVLQGAIEGRRGRKRHKGTRTSKLIAR